MNELKEHSLKEASELAKVSQDVASLSEEELNAPVDEVGGENIAFKSLDCRSECKYHTGETHKYANYGFSD